MSLQSIAVVLPCTDTSIRNTQLHRLSRNSPLGLRWVVTRRLVISNAQEPSKEIRLDKEDLMALEFGRLLGESKQETISKVVRRKMDPNATFIGIEKQAKSGKDIMSKAGYTVKLASPKQAAANASMLAPDFPHLASPPKRQHGSSINFSETVKLGARVASQVESLDDSLLRKPSTSIEMRENLPVSSEQSAQVKRNGQRALMTGLKAENLSSQWAQRTDNKSMEASKLEFQRLLDESFDTSPVASKLHSLVSPPSKENFENATIKLSSPKRPHPDALPFQSEGDQSSNEALDSHNQDSCESAHLIVPSALPSLASPPSRLKGSLGTFVQPARARAKVTLPSIKGPPSEALNESLLRKPGVALSPTPPSEESFDSQDEGSSDSKLHNNVDTHSSLPNLTSPPSRHVGTFGTFVQPRSRATQSPANEILDESLLRKPSLSESKTGDRDLLLFAEPNVLPRSSVKQTHRFESGRQLRNDVDDMLKPLKGEDITQTDGTTSNKHGGSQQNGSKTRVIRPTAQAQLLTHVSQDNFINGEFCVGDIQEQSMQDENTETLPVNLVQVTDESEGKAESIPDIRTPSYSYHERLHNGSGSTGQGSDKISKEALLGRSQDVDENSERKIVKVAALKKPIRHSPSSSIKWYTPKGNNVLLDRLPEQEAIKHSNNNGAEGGSGMVDKDLDLKILHKGKNKVGEEIESQVPVELISVAVSVPKRASANQKKQDQTKEVLLEGASREILMDSPVEKSTNSLRRPHAELSSQQLDLRSPDVKLHQEEEEKEWVQAEALLKSKDHVEVKLIGSNSAGLIVSFGCLVGFLPSFELSSRRGLLDFASWAQQKGFDLNDKSSSVNGINQNEEVGQPNLGTQGGLNELRNMYKEEMSKLMSTFVGEKTKVIIKLLDKSGRKLRFSEKEADPSFQENAKKKANLMAELNLGDVVTCEVKSITPIGVFVELDGISALIHHSEVSWNTRVDPASLLAVGEVIKAKVCRLDRTLQRINLSLKQMQPDPLKLTLESVVGDLGSVTSMQELETIESEAIWPELEDLVKKIKQMDYISGVSMGRCLYSAAFAPTFQVLISTPQSNGYKLLARFGNKIQEILVDTTLDRDKMKEYIRLCTFSEA